MVQLPLQDNSKVVGAAVSDVKIEHVDPASDSNVDAKPAEAVGNANRPCACQEVLEEIGDLLNG